MVLSAEVRWFPLCRRRAQQANLMMYTEKAMKERKKLKASKSVRAEVKLWWQGLGKDMVKGLTRDEYIGLYLNLAPVLLTNRYQQVTCNPGTDATEKLYRALPPHSTSFSLSRLFPKARCDEAVHGCHGLCLNR
jgi:hypothetical protein